MRVLGLLAAVLAVPVQAGPEPEIVARLERLVRDLAAPDAVRRRRAADRLQRACEDDPAASGWVLARGAPADPEARRWWRRVRSRAGEVRQALELFAILRDSRVPDGKDLEFVRFDAGDRTAYGLLLHNGRVLDAGLRDRKPDAVRAVDLARHVARTAANPQPLFETCILAYWAHARGERVWLAASSAVFGLSSRVLASVRTELAGRLRRAAIDAAQRGRPFAELAERWAAVARTTRIAPTRAHGFRSVGKERPPEGRLERLVFDLRDTRMHSTLRESRRHTWFGPPGDPARRVLAAGWDVLPELVERLDDGRPTRGYDRDVRRNVWTPLTYESCARHLLYELTGKQMADIGQARAALRNATAGGRAGFYRTLLELGPTGRIRCRAAGELLKLDAERYATVVLARAARERVYAAAMLNAAEPYVLPRDRDRLRAFLTSRHSWVRLAAVRVLHRRCNDVETVNAFVRECAGAGPWSPDRSSSGIAFLCELERPDAARIVLRLLASRDRDVRYRTLDECWRQTDGDIFRVLRKALDDRRPTGRSASGSRKPILFRDVALRSLDRLLRRVGFDPRGDVAGFIARNERAIALRIAAGK